jgi:tetratricopeptide (TPR) repeat protein
MPEASLNPREIGALVALVDQNRLGEAERRARALLGVHPGAGMLWKILSVTLLRQGKDALPALQRAAELMPRDAEAHANLGAALHDRGQWAQAAASLFRALALRPDDAGTLIDAANALKGMGRAREAVPLYRRAIELQPRLAEAHNNLGNAFLALGEADDAAGCYRRVLAIDPTLSVAHNNLGLALAARGQPEEAAASYRQAVLLNPGYAEAMSNLGNVLRNLGDHREAASLYARAVEILPANAESHCNLGNALLELGRIDAAAESFRRALALQPEHPLAHVSLATALRLQRRGEEAEASCRAALAVDPNYAEALSLLGELHADRGRFSDAEELFRRAIAVDPQLAFAYWSIAAHRKMTQHDAAWLNGAQALLAKRLPLGQEISLRYALGKYFDDIGRYDEAFGHFQHANELAKRQGSNYDGEKLSRRVHEIIRHFDAPFVRRQRPHASDSELPVFIVGMPRSGTSLAEQILASHPDAFGAGELTFWDAAFAAFEKSQRDGAADANLISGAAEGYLDILTGFSGTARRVIDKNPSNFLYAGLIHAAFPKARIIHMRRHPIDTCLSIYCQHFFNMGAYANDLNDLAHYHDEYVRITDHWRSVLPATALLEVPYEALIEDQEGWTRRMLDFIALPWDAKCLDFHRTDRVVVTASKWQVRQKIHAASVGRWRNYQRFLGPLLRLADSTHHC